MVFSGLALGYLAGINVDAHRETNKKWGFTSYLISLFKKRPFKIIDFQFQLDGQKEQKSGNSFLVLNTLKMLGIRPPKKIDFTDGVFDVFVAQDKSHLGFLLTVFSFFFFEKWLQKIFAVSGKEIGISALPADISAQLDGDPIKIEKEDLKIKVVPKKLKVIAKL